MQNRKWNLGRAGRSLGEEVAVTWGVGVGAIDWGSQVRGS